MFVSKTDYENIKEVKEEYPEAVHIEEVDGGWHVFYSASDYEMWEKQA